MSPRSRRPGLAGALAVATALVVLAPATPAVARPDGGQTVTTQVSPSQGDCPLRRVGRHLVRCDFLTGAAPSVAVSVQKAPAG